MIHSTLLETPITRTAIPEQVVQRVLDLIRDGILRPGEKLPAERELAASMGVGRPSLREALRALSLLGVIDIRQGEGIFVSSLSPESLLAPLHFYLSLDHSHLDSLFEARLLIESGVTALAATKFDDALTDRLRACLDEGQLFIEDPEAFLQVDMRFHQLIVEAAGNPFLDRIAQSFHELGQASREITVYLPGVRQRSHKDHQRIFNALVKRDAKAASKAMEHHLLNVRNAYRRQYAKRQGTNRSSNAHAQKLLAEA